MNRLCPGGGPVPLVPTVQEHTPALSTLLAPRFWGFPAQYRGHRA